MRAERMISTLLLMQARGRVTARELATELDVSVATARRDLEALSTAGVPVYPQRGRGGGWSLVGGARTNLSGLTASESQALFLMLGPAASISPEVRSAMRKLLRALPGTFQDDAKAAAAAVWRDEPGWGELSRERPPEVDVVQGAIIDRAQITFSYTGRTGVPGTRTVSPLGLVDKDDLWYLLALPDGRHDASDVRTFRMDRVSAIEVTGKVAERPVGFDLAAEWRRVVEHIEAKRSLVSATVLVADRHMGVLRSMFGRHFDVLDDSGERIKVFVAAHTARSVAEQLAGWGAMVEVVEPDEVRREMARIGAELLAAYG
jgi:predicted DNA-binding transcriptional regulator YafY